MTPRRLLARFRRLYGASPWHLAAHLLALAIAAFALDQIVKGAALKALVVLFVGIALAHDLVFLPAYSALDRLLRAILVKLPARGRARAVPLVNHVRVPTVISAVLLLIYAPLISRQADAQFTLVTGHHLRDYALNWLLVTAALFAASAFVYAVRVLRAPRAQPMTALAATAQNSSARYSSE